MAFDAFLKLDGVDGDSTDRNHKGEIEIQSFSWGLSQTGAHGTGGGGGAGKVSFQDIHFSSKVNKSSPLLMKNCAQGTHIKKAVLTVRKAGGDQQEYYVVKMEDLLVSSYDSAGEEAGDAPADAFSINFAKIEFAFNGGDATTGGQ